MIERQLVDIAVQLDANGNPIERRKEMTYLLLFYATDPETGEEIRTFEVVDGRQRACDTIINMQSYMQIDIMKSQVISERINNIITNSISCYTFLRYCVDKDYMGDNTVDFGNDGDGNFMTEEDLNSFVLNEYEDILYNMGIYSQDDLDRFYRCDFNHEEYIPEEFKDE